MRNLLLSLRVGLLLLISSAQPLLASPLEDPLVSGHLKSLNLAYAQAPASPGADGFFSANSQRFELQGKLSDALELEVALNHVLLLSDPADQVSLPTDSPNQRFKLRHSWDQGRRWSGQVDIDRLSLKGNLGSFDWALGRQAVGFGRIALFSPLDIVAPFAPAALDTDIRPGVDALRMVRYFGLGGQIGGSLVFGDKTDNNSYLLTCSENLKGIDLLAIGGALRERQLVGLGLAGSLGTLGIKAEVSHYQGKDSTLPGGDLYDRFDIAALEFWYRFENGIVLLSEYLYNGAGASSPSDYNAAMSSASYLEGLSFLLGQQYLLLGPSWQLHPLVTLSGLLIRNLDDDSTLLRPQVQLSLGDNLSLDLFYSLNLGREPQVLAPDISVMRSEFGTGGDSGGLLLRWYF